MTAVGSGWGQDKLGNGLEVVPEARAKEEPSKDNRIREWKGKGDWQGCGGVGRCRGERSCICSVLVKQKSSEVVRYSGGFQTFLQTFLQPDNLLASVRLRKPVSLNYPHSDRVLHIHFPPLGGVRTHYIHIFAILLFLMNTVQR